MNYTWNPEEAREKDVDQQRSVAARLAENAQRLQYIPQSREYINLMLIRSGVKSSTYSTTMDDFGLVN